MNMIPDGAIVGGIISKIINDLTDVSKSKIKKAVEDKKNKHKSLEPQLYNLIVNVLKEMNDNSDDKNSDKIYDTAEKLLKCFIEYGRENEDAIRYALKNILSCVDDEKCIVFRRLLIQEISKDEYNELYREIRLLQEEKKYKKTDRIEQKVDHLDQKLDDIRKNDERIIRNTNNNIKFHNNKKQDYINNWNSRLFLHIDNDERPITLSDAFIMPDYEYHIKDRGMKLSDIDTMNEIIEKFIKHNRSANMLITGVPGIGKTSIVSWIANEYKENSDIIILRFRDWEKEELKAGLLKAICNVLNCIKRDLEGKIIIIDGFDEIKILNNGKDLLINFFNEILDYKNFKIIVTSRPDYIESNKFQYIFKLLPFQINEIKQFYQTIKGTVLESNLQNHNFDVLGIPVILYMAIMAGIDITENATKSELYTKIFAEKGGIFDKFSFNGFGYDYGEQILREGNNAKKYLDFLKDVSFQMFEKDRLVLMHGEYKVPELVFQDANISILEFPIKHLFENTELSIEFVHKSIFEYFLSEYIFESIRNVINASKEELACILGILFKRNILYKDIEEFLAYRIKNSELYEKYKFINASFRLMLQDGMTYHTNKHYKNIVKCEMRVFANMLRILHLWQKPVYLQSFRYLKYNTGIKLDLSGIDFQKKHLRGIDLRKSNLKEANLKEAFFRRMDLREVDLSGANINGLDLSGSDIRGAILDDTIFDTLVLRGTIIDENQADYLKGKCDLHDVKVYLRKNKKIVNYEEYCRSKQ